MSNGLLVALVCLLFIAYGLLFVGQAALLWRAARSRPSSARIAAFLAALQPPLSAIYGGGVGHVLFLRTLSGTVLADELYEMGHGDHPLTRLTPYAIGLWGAFPLGFSAAVLLSILLAADSAPLARILSALLLAGEAAACWRALRFGRSLARDER
jgi:hypothetical protein